MKTKRQEQFRTGFRSVQRLHPWVTAKVLMLLVMLMVSVQGAWAQKVRVNHLGVNYTLTALNEYQYAEVESLDDGVADVFIPASITYEGKDYEVIRVNMTFRNNTLLRSVVFEDGKEIDVISGFYGDTNLQRVVLPKGLKLLQQDFFKYCSQLTTVVLPDGLTNIGALAFDGCSSLRQLDIPNTVTELEVGYNFNGCTSLQSIKLPEGITTIPERAFQNCSSLKELVIPDGVNSIAQNAFQGCEFHSIHIPAGLTNYDYQLIISLFRPMIPTLEKITVSPNNTYFFSPDNCNAIIDRGGSIFLGCRNTVIPDNTTISSDAFQGCKGLTSITLPQKVWIASGAFNQCPNLETIICTSSNPANIRFFNGLNIDKDKVTVMVPHNLLDLYKANEGFRSNFNEDKIISNPATIKKYFISEIRSFGTWKSQEERLAYQSDALSDYSSIHNYKYALEWEQSSSIFKGITGLILVKHTHGNITGLKNIPDEFIIDGKTYTPLPRSYQDHPVLMSDDSKGEVLFQTYYPYVTRDGNDLSGAKILSGLEFSYSQEPLTDPDFVRGLDAVYDLEQRGHVFTFVDNQDWNECAGTGDGHTYTYVKAIYDNFQTPYDEIHYSTTDDTQLVFENGAFGDNVIAEHTYVYGAGVIRFNNIVNGRLLASAFAHKANVKNIILPPGIMEIEDGAFEGCTSLENISFSPDMRYIGASAFRGCQSLLSVTLPNQLTTLGEGAFEGCSSLSSIEVPENLTTLAANVFNGCTSLETVKLPRTLTSIGASAFAYCLGLKNINAADLVNITSIGNRAFYGCSSLAKVEFVDHQNYDAASLVECEVGTEAFARCTGMTLITMPKMSHIPSKLFAGCTTLWTVYVPVYTGNMDNDIADDAFNKAVIAGIYLKEATGVTTIPAGKFRGYSQLRGFEFPYTLESIGEYAFASTGFTKLSFGWHRNLTDIGEGAFSSCQQLTDLVLPPSLTTIKAKTFVYCPNLKTVNFFNSVQNIGEQAFENCYSLQTILFGTALQNIGSRAFASCKNIHDIVTDLAYEGVYATNLDCFDAEVYANGTLHKMGENKNNSAIYGNAPWSSFTKQDNGGTYYYEQDGCTYRLYPDNYETPDGRQIRGAVLISGGRSYNYPEYINGDYPLVAFATGSISNVVSIIIPRNVIRLEEGFVTSAPDFWSLDFARSQGILYVDKTLNYPTLHEITIDRDVECLNGGLFEGLQSTSDNEFVLKIGNDASYLPKNCFKNSNLKRIEFRSRQVFGFEEGAFAGCKQIRDIIVLASWGGMDETRCSSKTFETEVNRNANLRWEGNAEDIERYKTYQPWVNFVDPEVTQVIVDDAVYRIYPRCSYNYHIKGGADWFDLALTGAVLTGHKDGPGHFKGDVVIPEKVAGFPVIAVAENTFAGYGGVTSLSLPGTLRMIENDAVWAMGDLEKFTIRDQKFPRGEVCRIGYKVFDLFDEEAFYRCDKLKEVSIGVDLTWEGTEDEPFEDRHGLRTIRITPGCHWFGKPYVSGSTNTYLFNSCDAVEEIIIEDGTEPIHFYGEAFEGVGHSNIKKLYVGRSLDTDNLNFGDGEMPFWRMGDDDGSQIIIGDQVEYIGQRAFGKTFFTDVHFGRGLKRIGKEAFCNSLELRNATGYCPNLEVIEEIAFDGAPFQLCMWCDPNHPEESKIKRIEDYATGNIKNIYLPLSLEYLGKSVATTNKKVYLYHSKDEVKNLQIHKEFYDRSDKPAEVYAACSYSQNELDDIFHAHDRVTINKNIFYHVGNHQKGTRKSLISGLYNSECDVCHADLTQLNQLYNCYYYAPQWDGTNDLELYRTAKYSYTYNGVLNIQDNKPFRVPVDITTDGVIYNRTVTGGRVVTFALPFESDASEVNGKVYKFREFSDGKFCFDEQDGNLEAKVPYLVVVNEDATTLFNNVSATALKQTLYVDYNNVRKCRVTDSNSGAEHVGTFVQETFAEGDEGKSYYGYASTDGMFVKAKTATLNPFRTMFTLPQAAQMKRVMLQLGDDNTTTGTIQVDTDLLDGEGSPMYDLNGVRIVTSPVRGKVYIQNGKKMISK